MRDIFLQGHPHSKVMSHEELYSAEKQSVQFLQLYGGNLVKEGILASQQPSMKFIFGFSCE